ncbi:MAG: TraI domain-containing protein [Succinivibrio sp.]|nr:TraI domain-containing protein [Succinivibrio sp.]
MKFLNIFNNKTRQTQPVITDNLINDNYKLVTADGSVVLQCSSSSELIRRNKGIIRTLCRELQLQKDTESYFQLVKLIDFFVNFMSITPASQCGHDSEAGGLFKHSLLTSHYLIKFFNQDPEQFKLSLGDKQNLSKTKPSLVLLGFLHDIGKLYTDLDICTLGKKFSFNVTEHELLSSFISKYQATHLRFYYKKNRTDVHETLFHLNIEKVIENMRIYIPEVINKLESTDKESLFYRSINLNKTSSLYAVIKAADGMAVVTSIERFEGFQHITSVLQTAVNVNFINIYKTLGFFKTNRGLLVQAGSEAFQQIVRLYDMYNEYIEISKNFDTVSFLKAYKKCIRTEQSYFYDSSVLADPLAPYTNLFADNDLPNLMKHNDDYVPRRKSIFNDMSNCNFIKQMSFNTPYRWYVLSKFEKSHFVKAFYIPGFEFYEDSYIMTKQLHVTEIEDILFRADVKKKDRDVTYFEFNHNYSYEDYIKEDPKRIDCYFDKLSVQYNDFKMHRRQETIELCKKRKKVFY